MLTFPQSARWSRRAGFGIAALLLLATRAPAETDPLPSWNDGAAKQAIIAFVTDTTTEGSATFVPPEKRIAAFDQDGTLWVEHPVYSQVVYALEHVGDLIKAKPELAEKEPFKTVTSGDHAAMEKLSFDQLMEIVVATQSGMSVDEFSAEVNSWLAASKDPRWKRPYTDLVYQPMQEVLALFRSHGYKTFIATGGSEGFVRPYSEQVYGIPPEQVSGSAQPLKYNKDLTGQPSLTREPKIVLNNLDAGKIENFWLLYGQKPIAAFGNSSSDDQQMLEYAQGGDGPGLSVVVMHDDADREYAYGPAQGLPDTEVGTLSQAMYDEAIQSGWIVISMKNDWNRIFSFAE